MKIRGYKPEIWTDGALGEVSRDARLLFFALISLSCDNGHVKDDPRDIRRAIFSGSADRDIGPDDVSAWLDELDAVAVAMRGDGVITVPKLRKHQGKAIDPRYFKGCDLVSGCNEEADEIRKSARRGKKAQVTGHDVAPT